jgi:hypothetical protein
LYGDISLRACKPSPFDFGGPTLGNTYSGMLVLAFVKGVKRRYKKRGKKGLNIAGQKAGRYKIRILIFQYRYRGGQDML